MLYSHEVAQGVAWFAVAMLVVCAVAIWIGIREDKPVQRGSVPKKMRAKK